MKTDYNMKNWADAHHFHCPDTHHMFDEAFKLMHNPAFWLVMALLLVIIAFIILGVLFGQGEGTVPIPPMTYPLPMYP